MAHHQRLRVRIENRTYDCAELGPFRRQHSGLAGKRGLWEIHYDPYELSQVHVRTPEGWITAPWTHKAMVTGPFADFTWNHARGMALARSQGPVTETDIARALEELLTRAEHGPDRAGARILARTRTAAAAHRPAIAHPDATAPTPAAGGGAAAAVDVPAASAAGAEVVPFGVFDADAEAERWL